MTPTRPFPDVEYQQRLGRLREAMSRKGLEGCLVTSPENVFYLTGLDHQGYFALQVLVVPLEGQPTLVTRAMEQAIVRDRVPDVRHLGFSDGVQPLPPASDRERDLLMGAAAEGGSVEGLEPWSMSLGVSVRGREAGSPGAGNAVRAVCQAVADLQLSDGKLGVEKNSAFLPWQVAEELLESLPGVTWHDAAGLVDDLRLIQSPREQTYTRQAACVTDAMILAGIAAAGSGVYERDVMSAIYQASFQRGGTYPGFVPLVRTTHTLAHEHGTWDAQRRIGRRDVLFLEMSGCVHRYHAPAGRLVHIGSANSRAARMLEVCRESIERVAETIGPGVKACDVYRAWKERVDRAGLSYYHRHHCGYSVGIGFPPSWSGSGVPRGLRETSNLELQPGMVFHLLSWLLRTGKGDSFISDTALVTDKGCEILTRVPRDLTVRH